jgi:transposase
VPRKLSNYVTAIREQVAARPDATLEELRQWLRETHEVSVSLTLLWQTLAHLKLTRKKRPCMARSRTARTWPRPASNGVGASPV